MNEQDTMCRNVPISATYRIIDGKPVEVSRVEADIPAKAIAKFLIHSFGITAIFGGGDND